MSSINKENENSHKDENKLKRDGTKDDGLDKKKCTTCGMDIGLMHMETHLKSCNNISER